MVLTGCDNSFYVDQTLRPFVEEFRNEAAVRGIGTKDVTVVIADIERQGVMGLYYASDNRIEIDRDFVRANLGKSYADSTFVKLVVWHELGHAMGKAHRPGLSIMNGFGAGDFILTLRAYIVGQNKEITDELFSS